MEAMSEPQKKAQKLQHREIVPTDYETLCELDTEAEPQVGEELAQVEAMIERCAPVTSPDVCSICRDKATTHSLPCGHAFCRGCLLQTWTCGPRGGVCMICQRDATPGLLAPAGLPGPPAGVAAAASRLQPDGGGWAPCS